MSVNIGLSLSSIKLEVAPGESVEATITVRNQSKIVDQFAIKIYGLDPTWWTLSPASVSLFPGEQDTVKLTVHPPKEAEAKAGSYSFQVRAISQANPEEVTQEEAFLILRGFTVWELEMSPTKVVGEGGTYKITASNLGNTDVTLAFECKDPEEALNYAFSQDKVTVPVGKSALTTLKVRPKKGEKGKLYSFQVLGRPADIKAPIREVKTINGQLEYRRRRGWWWIILLILSLLAAIGVLCKFLLPSLRPTIHSFSAEPASITVGSASTLSWNVSRATSVTISPGVGSVSPSGSQTIFPTVTTTYVLKACGLVGCTTRSASVTVGAPLPVVESFTANPSSITAGGSSTLSWKVSGANQVAIDQGIGDVALTGSRTVSPTAGTTYTLRACNAAGCTTATARIEVSAVPLPVINSFTASPSSISAGGIATLSWNVSGASKVVISPGIGEVPSSGTRTVSPSTTTTYTLVASNVSGNRTATVLVTVSAAPQTVYDFIAKASHSRTVWESGAGILTFPGATNNNKGFACYQTNIVLEDNRTYSKVLETHPQWVDNGYIQGTYFELSDIAYTVRAGDRFYAKVGFIKNAAAGSVKFRVMICPQGGPNTWIATVTDVYDGTLRIMDVDLAPYAGKKAYFILRVEANGPSTQDWAAWVEARIIR